MNPPAPRVSSVYFTLFGSGYAGLGDTALGYAPASVARWGQACRRVNRRPAKPIERPRKGFSFRWDRQFESGLLQRRVGCELDSWIMVGADGLGSKEDVRVFNLIVLAQFVWRAAQP